MRGAIAKKVFFFVVWVRGPPRKEKARSEFLTYSYLLLALCLGTKGAISY